MPSWTKRQIINQAFGEIGLAAYVFDLTADEIQDALLILDSMMAEWAHKGILFDPVYPVTIVPGGGNLNEETNAPPEANRPIWTNLAVLIAPGFGKSPSPQTMLSARAGFSFMSETIPIPTVQMSNTIRGAGGKYWGALYPFIPPKDEVVE